MTGMFRSLDLLVLSCIFQTVISEAGKISPPQNLMLRWINEFTPELSWIQDPERNCNYTLDIKPQTGEEIPVQVNTTKWSDSEIIFGRSLHFKVTADCNGSSSDPALYGFSSPELVKKVDCHYYAPHKSRCQWDPASDASELRFFFRLRDNKWHKLQECSSYSNNTDGVKTGCELQADHKHTIYMFFNGTVNRKPARNTFKILLKDYVRPPPLNWTVVESKDNFSVSWIPPDIVKPENWKYNMKYTKCNEPQSFNLPIGEKTYPLPRDPQCHYCIFIQAEVAWGGKGATPWSLPKCFDKDNDKDNDKGLDPLVSVAVIIPCVVAILAALMFVCCRTNKDKFWPEIITPVDFITDIDNNNKSNLYNLQVPAEEEQTCEITVLDPEITRLDC